jgi:hypothetical protein
MINTRRADNYCSKTDKAIMVDGLVCFLLVCENLFEVKQIQTD